MILPQKKKPDVEDIKEGDILFIPDFKLNGKRDPHYFLVLDHYVPFDDDPSLKEDSGLEYNGYRYTTHCVLMGSDKGTEYDANILVPKEHTVWYADAKMPPAHKEKDSIVRTDTQAFFDLRTMRFRQCGELLSNQTFDKSELNAIPEKQRDAFKKLVEKTGNIYKYQICGTMDSNADLGILQRSLEHLPDYIKEQEDKIKRATERKQQSKPKRTLTPEQETSVLLMKEHVDNEDKPKPTTTTTAPNPYNE